MKKNLLLWVMGITISLFVVSCKKYEEGPAFSLASKTGRVAGTWKVESCKGVDASGTETDYTIEAQYEFPKIEFSKGHDVKFYDLDGEVYETAIWKFDDDKENILITFDNNGYVWTWEIIRLKQKELWVKDNYNLVPDEVLTIKFKQ